MSMIPDALRMIRRLILLVPFLFAHAASVSVHAAPDAAPSRTPSKVEMTDQGRANHQPQGEGRAFFALGRNLFMNETFGGNGRSCLTCHSPTTGTLSPEEAQARLIEAAFPPRGLAPGLRRAYRFPRAQGDALFRAIDSDDGLGELYNRLLEHATIRVHLNLPANVSLESDPSARSVVVHRGIPSTIDSGLATVLMQDGRAPNLETQALGAVLGHFEPTRLPSARQLHQIAEFERTQFSRPELARFFQGGPPPPLPEGTTPEEVRGRRHFQPGGLCNLCHAGPMLNETSALHPTGAGQRFENIRVSERNVIGNPVYTFLIQNANGTTSRVRTPDPGLALVRSDTRKGLFATGPVNFFKIPSLWNVRQTAPYFHDNSAKTLEEVLGHYRLYLPLSDQDAKDIIAFLKLL